MANTVKKSRFEAIVEHEGEFCAESCKWLSGACNEPWCYLFGRLDASNDECTPLRHKECINGAKLIHEDYPA